MRGKYRPHHILQVVFGLLTYPSIRINFKMEVTNMKKLFLFCFVLSLICPPAVMGQENLEECTIGVASGKATADGRPLLWKNADGSYGDREVVYVKDGRFKYLALAVAGWPHGAYAGVNEFGFCMVTSLAFDLPDKSEKGFGGEGIMRVALQQCVTVDDFENLLKQTNVSGRRTTLNIGVIDAFGGAAIFETGNFSYTRFDANDRKAAPKGYIIRANFALTGGGDSGRARYVRANQLWQQAVEKDQLDYRYVLRKVCRDLSGAEKVSYTPPEMEATEDNTLQALNNENAISRPGTRWVALFHGVRPDENPSLTTFWAIIGGPIFSVAVPSWVIAESTAPEMDGEQFSLLCTAARDLYLANYVTGDKRTFLLNPEMLPDIWAMTYPAEDRIFDQTESIMTQWRQDYPTAQQVASFHQHMAYEAMNTLQDATGMLMQKGGPTAHLRIALHMRSVEKAKAFIEGSININVSDGHAYTPLHYAVQNNLDEIVELLISKNADVNAKNRSGQTPLDMAVRQNYKEIAELLIKKGADVTSLHITAQYGLLEKSKELIEKKTDVNAKDTRGRTALHFAARHGHKEIVEVLLAHGADVDARDKSGRTPAERALFDGHSEIIELLISNGADVYPLYLAVSMRDLDKVRRLIRDGADVNKRTQYGIAAIQIAAVAGFRDITELLIDKGADVNAEDGWDWTSLHSAAEGGHRELAELLIAKGANVNARDGGGPDAFMVCQRPRLHRNR